MHRCACCPYDDDDDREGADGMARIIRWGEVNFSGASDQVTWLVVPRDHTHTHISAYYIPTCIPRTKPEFQSRGPYAVGKRTSGNDRAIITYEIYIRKLRNMKIYLRPIRRLQLMFLFNNRAVPYFIYFR